jgi:hypothetical protein
MPLALGLPAAAIALLGLVVAVASLLPTAEGRYPETVLVSENVGGVTGVNLLAQNGRRFYLVRLPDDSLVALSSVEPAGPWAGCRIVARSDASASGSHPSTAPSEAGFFSPCSGARWDLAGIYVGGAPSRIDYNVTYYPLSVNDDGSVNVKVDDARCTRRVGQHTERLSVVCQQAPGRR